MSSRFILIIFDYIENMESYVDDFRLNIKFYREQQGITQTQLSVICDCGTGTIGGIESGKVKPSFDMIIKIAEALKVHPADLFMRNVTQSRDNIRKELQTQFNRIINSL